MSEMVRAEASARASEPYRFSRRHALGRARPGVGARRTLWFGQVDVLRCINHLETVSAGRLYVDGDLIGVPRRPASSRDVPRDTAKQRRDIGMVFQRFSLFPHPDHTGQHTSGAGARERRQQVGGHRPGPRTAPAGRAGGQSRRLPAQLSGGQQQQVAIAGRWPWTRLMLFDDRRPP